MTTKPRCPACPRLVATLRALVGAAENAGFGSSTGRCICCGNLYRRTRRPNGAHRGDCPISTARQVLAEMAT